MLSHILAGLIFLAAGFVQGMTGFGSALVAIPLLSMVMDIKTAVPLCMLNSLIITGYLSRKLHNHLDRRKILPLVVGALPGILVGVTLLKRVDSSIIRIGIGLLLISYSMYGLLARAKPVNPARGWGYIAGFFTGAIGAAFSAGGPPAIIYTTLTNWKKDEIKATLTGFFAVNAAATAVIHALSGVTTRATLGYFAVTAGFVLAGTITGALLTGRIKRTTYLRLIYSFLIVMGAMMIVT